MKSERDLIKTKSYWMVKIQGDLFFILETYMKNNNLTKKEFCKRTGFKERFIAQVLNGNFNGSLSKLIELCLALDIAPVLELEDINKYILSFTQETLNQNEISSTQEDIK